MKKYLFIALIFLSDYTFSQPTITWQKCFGGSVSDWLTDGKPTLDGGYICMGKAISTDFDLLGVCCPNGGAALWVVKLDSNFDIEWQKLFNTTTLNEINDIFVNLDSTYTIFGTVEVSAIECTCNHSESQDIWMINLDISGNILSQKCFGGSSYDVLNNVIKCQDGGYLIGAYSGSINGDVGYHFGSGFVPDALVLKIDAQGNIKWTKVLGGTGYDGAFVAEITENEYFINVNTSSSDYDLTGLMPIDETGGRWLILMDSTGQVVKENFDRSFNFQFNLFTPYKFVEGQFIIVGYNQIDTGIFSDNKGGVDAIVGLYNSELLLTDVVQFGGSELDEVLKVNDFGDGHYYFSGWSRSSDFDCQPNHGERDAFLVKTDSSLNKIWSKTFGASGDDRIGNIMMNNGTLYAIGLSNINGEMDGDITNGHFIDSIGSNGEGYIMSFSNSSNIPDSLSTITTFLISPNPTSGFVQIKSFSTEECQLNIISMEGKRVETFKINLGTNSIDVSDLAKGFYIFNIVKEQNISLKQVKILIN